MAIILSKSIPAGGRTFIQICKDLNESLEINYPYKSFWYKRFLGVLRGIQIGEVTLLISGILLLAFFGSNTVDKGFMFIAKW